MSHSRTNHVPIQDMVRYPPKTPAYSTTGTASSPGLTQVTEGPNNERAFTKRFNHSEDSNSA